MGVVSDISVLGPKDIDDVPNFAAKHGMDYVFASFVQSANDMWMKPQGGFGLHLVLRPCRFLSHSGYLQDILALFQWDGK
jgi:hypothetical protein